jgi:hypothetical protein
MEMAYGLISVQRLEEGKAGAETDKRGDNNMGPKE